MAVKYQGGKAVQVEDGLQKGIRMRSSLPDNYYTSWEGDADTVNRYAAKLKAAGFTVVVKPGYRGLMELELNVGSVVRRALGPIGALPLNPGMKFEPA